MSTNHDDSKNAIEDPDVNPSKGTYEIQVPKKKAYSPRLEKRKFAA